jgi:hypothetical protein
MSASNVNPLAAQAGAGLAVAAPAPNPPVLFGEALRGRRAPPPVGMMLPSEDISELLDKVTRFRPFFDPELVFQAEGAVTDQMITDSLNAIRVSLGFASKIVNVSIAQVHLIANALWIIPETRGLNGIMPMQAEQAGIGFRGSTYLYERSMTSGSIYLIIIKGKTMKTGFGAMRKCQKYRNLLNCHFKALSNFVWEKVN